MTDKYAATLTGIVGTLLLTLCVINCAYAQYAIPDMASVNATDLLELFDNLDIQRHIRDMQSDGSLYNIAQILIGLGTAEYTINSKCMEDFFTAAQGISNFKMWALQMIDAIGKPHTGLIYDLDFTWDGSYDECLDIKAITYSNESLQSDPVHHFDGKYCQVGLPLPRGPGAEVGLVLNEVLQSKVKIGICIPDSCHTEDMKNIMLFVARTVFNASTEYDPDVVCHDGFPVETKTIVAICIYSLFGMMVVIGTLYDIYLRLSETTVEKEDRKEKSEPNTSQTIGHVNTDVKIELSEMSGENVYDVIKENPKITDNSVADFKSVTNGISMDSMKVETTQKLPNQRGKNSVAYFLSKNVQQWTFYGIFSATVSVDTFFTMSGLLVSYLSLREMSKRGGAQKMNWFLFYFHRFWRLTPVYMLVLMFNATITKHIGDGPRWPQHDIAEENCARYWWTNFLYMNNYYPGVEHGCFIWSWYLVNDMQFYILSPLIVIPLFYNVTVGCVVGGIFLVGTTVTRAVIAKQHEYTALFDGIIGPKPKDEKFSDNLYLPGYSRIGPYVIGVFTGYLLYRYKDSFKMNKIWNFLGWFTCLSIIVLVIYGVYPDHEKHYLSVNESVAYVTLHRTGWGIAISWIIFACATGHGGWINNFLSWSPFCPLGRVSYCAYLVHLIELSYYRMTLRQPLYYTDLQQIYVYIGNVVLSYMAAFVTSLMFEAPMMGLEKVMLGRA